MTNQEVREVQLEILDKVCKFCKANDIKFFMMYGSLIGAIREKGYIPWDDDIDICMKREEYDRFIELFSTSQNQLVVRDQSLESDFPFYFAKICMPNTCLIEKIDGKEYNIGINIDLFPLDNVPDSLSSRKAMYRKINSIRKKLVFKTIDKDKKRNAFKTIALKLGGLLCNRSAAYYYDKLRKVVRGYQNEPSSMVTEIMTPYGERAILDSNLFDGVAFAEFENLSVPVPADYDKILRKIYGDYMTPPSVEKRVTHHSFNAYKSND